MCLIVDDYVWHFSVAIKDYAKIRKTILIEVSPLFAGVSRIQQNSSGNEPRRKVFNDCFDKFAVAAWT
jgi:hypothetical protein